MSAVTGPRIYAVAQFVKWCQGECGPCMADDGERAVAKALVIAKGVPLDAYVCRYHLRQLLPDFDE